MAGLTAPQIVVVACAVKAVAIDGAPCTEAPILTAPGFAPKVAVLVAIPVALVTEVADPKVAGPEVTLQVTVTPETT